MIVGERDGARKLPFAARAPLSNGGYPRPWGTTAVGHFLPLVAGSFLASHLAMHTPPDALWGCRPMACTRGSEVVDLVRTQAPHGVAIARSLALGCRIQGVYLLVTVSWSPAERAAR